MQNLTVSPPPALYFLPLNIANQTVKTSKTYQLFESPRGLPTVLSEFLSFSASRVTASFLPMDTCNAQSVSFLQTLLLRENFSTCYINLFLIARSIQVFVNESCSHTSCTGRINTNYGSPLVNLSLCSALLEGWSHQGVVCFCQSCSMCSL